MASLRSDRETSWAAATFDGALVNPGNQTYIAGSAIEVHARGWLGFPRLEYQVAGTEVVMYVPSDLSMCSLLQKALTRFLSPPVWSP